LIINSIENGLERIVENKIIALFLVVTLGIVLRIYFMPWEYPINSPDAFVYLNEAINYSKGNFEQFNTRFIWPIFLSIFFQFSSDSHLMAYTTIMRIVSISVSVITIPIIYAISNKFVNHKWAILCASIFTLEANLLENSIFGITETLFILIGLLSFYFAIKENKKFIPISFLFAGIAFDTRLSGIVLLIFLFLICYTRFSGKKLFKYLIIGIIIFVGVTLPQITISLEDEQIPYLKYFFHLESTIQEDPPFVWKGDSRSNNIIFDAVQNEVLHIFRILVPYLALFVPFGIIIALKELDWKKKMLFAIIIISLIVAIPQYTISEEYRNLFFIIPFFSILSVIGIQELGKNTNLKNILLILFIGGLLLLSFNFLRERYDVDQEFIQEKYQIGKYVVDNLQGKVSGDLKMEVWTQIDNASFIENDSGGWYSNQKISFQAPVFRIANLDDLQKFSTQHQINYLIVDNIDDNHFPVFKEIFYNEDDYPFLEKIYDTDFEKFKKVRIKIFEINHNNLK
jgi:hypothetical protein